MKKLLSLILFYTGLLALSVILYSCCNDPEDVTIIGGGDITFWKQGLPISVNSQTDTLTGLPFRMNSNLELLLAANFIDQGFVSSAYGLSCEPNYINELVYESFALTCDNDFIFDGETISAGTDFSELESVFVSNSPETLIVSLDQIFMDNATFPNGPTTFRMTISTTDNLNLESVGTVEITM